MGSPRRETQQEDKASRQNDAVYNCFKAIAIGVLDKNEEHVDIEVKNLGIRFVECFVRKTVQD